MANKGYFKKAHNWYADQYLSVSVWSNRWKWAFIGQSGLSLLLALSLLFTVPLKTLVPFPILVNEDNQIIKALHPKDEYLPVNEAMAQNDIVRYIRNREGFNPHTLNHQYKHIFFSTASEILSDFENIQSSKNPNSLINVLGVTGMREVKIHDVVFLDSKEASDFHKYVNLPSHVAQVDFSTLTQKEGLTSTEHWVAVLSFDYQGIPQDELRAWENWNGFVVTSYKVNVRNV